MTVKEAAEWMLERLEVAGFLYQEEAASYFLHLHDEALAYYDANSNVCVGKSVLAEFNKLSPDAVYERADKFWRHRLTSDQPGRQQ
jgi:formylmethanofuran dehydrogenase subunit B